MPEAQGQAQAAPAASARTDLRASAVVNPGAKPVEKILALLQAEKPVEPGERMVQQPPANPPAAAQPPQPEQPAPAEAPQPEKPEGEAAAQPEAPAEPQPNQQVEGEAKQPDAATQEIPLDTLLAIPLETTVKGEDGADVVQKLSIKELQQGYMRQADYSRKTAEVARQRESVSDEIRKSVESERAAYYQTLQTLQEVVISSVDTELKTANWSELAANDPATYVRLDNRRKEIDRVLGELTAKQQEVLRQRDAERAKVRREQATKSVEVLEKKIPGWNDAHYQKLMKAAQDYGYKPDEVGEWVDHRAFEVLHDAYQYRQMKATQKPDAPLKDNRVVTVPKVVKPGPAAPATAAKSREAEAMKQLQKRGSVVDAAAVIKARMG